MSDNRSTWNDEFDENLIALANTIAGMSANLVEPLDKSDEDDYGDRVEMAYGMIAALFKDLRYPGSCGSLDAPCTCVGCPACDVIGEKHSHELVNQVIDRTQYGCPTCDYARVNDYVQACEDEACVHGRSDGHCEACNEAAE